MKLPWRRRAKPKLEIYDPAQPLAFMHVPKTAGTSIITALEAAIRPRHGVFGFDPVLFGDHRDFASFAEPVRRVMLLDTLQFPPAADFVAGHIARHTLQSHYPQAQMVTILREPVCRLLSHWLFWRGHDETRLAEWGSWATRVRLARLTLAAFLEAPSLACQNDNLVVRMLLWPHRLIPADGFIDSIHDRLLLGEAERQLNGFAFLDIMENPALAIRLRAWLGRDLAMERRNETTAIPLVLRSPLDGHLDRTALDLLTRHTRLDLALWRRVARRTLTAQDMDRCRHDALLQGVARHATLMAP